MFAISLAGPAKNCCPKPSLKSVCQSATTTVNPRLPTSQSYQVKNFKKNKCFVLRAVDTNIQAALADPGFFFLQTKVKKQCYALRFD